MAGVIVLVIRRAGEAGPMSGAQVLVASWLPAYAFLYIVFLYLPVHAAADLLGQHLGGAEIPALGLHLEMVRRACRARRRCSTPPGTA